jgi:hypothetical protein
VFSTWSALRCYKQGRRLELNKLCMGGCEKRILAGEPQESPMLEAVTSERLVKTKQARKVLAGGVICKVWS